MKPFAKILVSLGDRVESEVATRRAVALAQACGASLTLVAVVDEVPPFLPNLFDEGRARRAHRDDVQRRLEQTADRLLPTGVPVSARMFTGDTAEELVGEAAQGGYDLVVRTARQRLSQGHEFRGAVDGELMRRCPAPVWLVYPGQRSFDRMTVAIDPQFQDARRDPLSIRLLTLAQAVADVDGAELHALSVLPTGADRDGAAAALAALIQRAGARVADERRHLLRGDPVREVPQFVADERVELLVMGTLSQVTAAGPMGRTAEAILECVDCSVLTAKPEGFTVPAYVTG